MENNLEEIPTLDTSVDEATEQSTDVRAMVESINLAKKLDEEKLKAISKQVKDGFEYDYESRRSWEAAAKEYTKLALQVKEDKTYPWPGASNVKYPLLSTAAMQFNARAYPSLVPSGGKVVKAMVVGKDPTGEKREKADRISAYMSYQFMEEMDCWEEDMDKLLIMLPIVGTLFKKTYFDSVQKKSVSKLVLAQNLVVNYWATSLEEAERISEIIHISPRNLKSKQLSSVYLDVDLGEPPIYEDDDLPNVGANSDETRPFQLIEQHCYIDLDDDGYAEPYIVIFERQSGEILRITARFTVEGVALNDKGNVASISPVHYYTKFGFIPNADGSFYDIGFGVLLGPLNESVNTLINQLLDAGHLNNLQGGFLGKGLKLKMGEQRFKPGEWKTINTTADDLKKQVLPLPTKEPSNVLFQLMGTLITSGKELASVAEIFVGKMPGQNTPATTTMATIEQGMKVFTAVYKRIYRSLKEEFKKLFELNGVYLNPEEYVEVLDATIGPEDFDSDNYDVCPQADPNAMSQTEKLMKAQGLLELLPIGILDPVEVVSRVLEAQEQPNWEKLLNKQIQQTGEFQPPPDPKMQEMAMKSQLEQQKIAMQSQSQQQKMALDARDKQVQLAMKAQEHEMNMQHKAQMAQLDAAEKIHMQRIFSAEAQNKMVAGALQGQQKLSQQEQMHQAKLKQAKETASLPSKNGASGKNTASRKPSSKGSKNG
jgi:chaperonin GroES